MSDNWYVIAGAPSLGGAGIFAWIMHGRVQFVGKSVRLEDRLTDYEMNLKLIAQNRPYKPDNPDGFRNIHRALYKESDAQTPAVFVVLETCDEVALTERRRYWIGLLNPPMNGRRT